MKTWTDEETRILLENYNKVTNDELQRLIPNKTRTAIYTKAYRMGFRQTKEIDFANRSLGRQGVHREEFVMKHGYRMIYAPNHPRANNRGRVFEHIIVWEREHGMMIPDGCEIHHINGNRVDNRPENLLMLTKGEHTTLHNEIRRKRKEVFSYE